MFKKYILYFGLIINSSLLASELSRPQEREKLQKAFPELIARLKEIEEKAIRLEQEEKVAQKAIIVHMENIAQETDVALKATQKNQFKN